MSTHSILLVEDNPDDKALTIRAFKKSEIEIDFTWAKDGREALRFLFPDDPAQKALNPELILLDLNLPIVHGLEVLRAIRADARTRKMPVVVLTSSKEEEDISKGYDLGCNSYVRKPVNFDEFVRAARELGTYWLTLNQPPSSEVTTQ